MSDSGVTAPIKMAEKVTEAGPLFQRTADTRKEFQTYRRQLRRAMVKTLEHDHSGDMIYKAA
jgi:hypothetical protein